ncbi:peptidase M23 [Maritimibacter sp. 55A14]|uniref:peptidoglycan DD-metalloendopeptidase family protein n=1 Tax=Maritimibacter sp. 55A14 TaxID=2174844 RepID=UPI000D6046A5|nr:peptidoglycan DD-metalloendopeptidase family protein [Maritimibacter sp. 55A14]PWE33919.1 peptidase M23 [Maritimibacter sp. 55A14]
MPTTTARHTFRLVASVAVAALLAGCEEQYDFSNLGPGLNNPYGGSPSVETAPRPEADTRGLLSYPGYQMVEARRGDTVADVAARIGMPAGELARHNGLQPEYELREGEILALPRRVQTAGGADITSIASSAIDEADRSRPAAAGQPGATPGAQPLRHRVARGETAFSIARLYNVSVRSLADWNGLGPDLDVREGQYLLIPVAASGATRQAAAVTTPPGQGSPTPVPPSASKPLPREVETATLPASPQLDQYQTDQQDGGTATAAAPTPKPKPEPTDTAQFLRPARGEVIRGYGSGNDGIDIAAPAGSPVQAADNGKVALISKSVGKSTIVLVRHDENVYTVYSNVVDVPLKKGDSVSRGQTVGKVASGSPSFVHFEVRRGTEAIDPDPFLN